MSTSHHSGSAGSGPHRHSVFGRVTDPGGRPVPADVFWVDGTHAGEETVELFDVHKVATADADGRFWAPDLPAGPGLLVADFQRLHVEDDRFRMSHGTRVVLPTHDEVPLGFPRERTEYGGIYGVVRDAVDRRPGARLEVKLLDAAGKVVREGETHTDGRFAFPMLLTPAKYRIVLFGSRRHLGGEIPADLARNGRIDVTVDQHRHPPGPRLRVRVRVADFRGRPLAGARIESDVPGYSIPPSTTGEHGVADVGDLPARPTVIRASAPGHWPGAALLPDGTPDAADDVAIELLRAVRLRVRIVDASTGRPVRHANLSVKGEQVDAVAWGGVLPPPDQPPRDFHDLPVRTGTVTVRAESPGYARAETVVEIGADADDEIEVTLGLSPRG